MQNQFLFHTATTSEMDVLTWKECIKSHRSEKLFLRPMGKPPTISNCRTLLIKGNYAFDVFIDIWNCNGHLLKILLLTSHNEISVSRLLLTPPQIRSGAAQFLLSGLSEYKMIVCYNVGYHYSGRIVREINLPRTIMMNNFRRMKQRLKSGFQCMLLTFLFRRVENLGPEVNDQRFLTMGKVFWRCKIAV
jgi:hypothetical protein